MSEEAEANDDLAVGYWESVKAQWPILRWYTSLRILKSWTTRNSSPDCHAVNRKQIITHFLYHCSAALANFSFCLYSSWMMLLSEYKIRDQKPVGVCSRLYSFVGSHFNLWNLNVIDDIAVPEQQELVFAGKREIWSKRVLELHPWSRTMKWTGNVACTGI